MLSGRHLTCLVSDIFVIDLTIKMSSYLSNFILSLEIVHLYLTVTGLREEIYLKWRNEDVCMGTMDIPAFIEPVQRQAPQII